MPSAWRLSPACRRPFDAGSVQLLGRNDRAAVPGRWMMGPMHGKRLKRSSWIVVACFVAGCSGAGGPESAPELPNAGPRPGSPMPSPWITAVEPHRGFNDEPALAVTPSGEVFVG